MRAKFLFSTVSMISAALVGGASVGYADDVFVNLSVLENLSPAQPQNIQGALFPIISADSVKAEKKAAVKKMKAKKVQKAKAKQEAKPTRLQTETKPSDSIKIPEKKEIKIDELLAKPQEKTLQPQNLQSMSSPEVKKVEETAPTSSNEDKTAPVVAAENVATVPTTTVENNNSVVENKNKAEVKEDSQAQTIEFKEPSTQTSAPEENILSTMPAAKPTVSEVSAPMAPTLENANEAKPELLVDATQKAPVRPSSEIYFAEDSDELTEENKAQISALIAGFENPQANKIAIYSFNLDNGEDSFRKKRMSLNRAIAARTFLLEKGYKNFSIKVVNIDSANGKENSIHIEELK